MSDETRSKNEAPKPAAALPQQEADSRPQVVETPRPKTVPVPSPVTGLSGVRDLYQLEEALARAREIENRLHHSVSDRMVRERQALTAAGYLASGSDRTLRQEKQKLEEQLAELRKKANEATAALEESNRKVAAAEAGRARSDQEAHAFRNLADENARLASEHQAALLKYEEQAKLAHLLHRVNPAGQRKLLEDPRFRAHFESSEVCPAYVVSVDVRRSTELMLKAREPALFAEFMHALAIRLRAIILDRYGIFDKFTGDGILGFFPEFFSGPDAGYLALDAAAACHEAFRVHYESHYDFFSTVLLDVGLGIGIDFGDVSMVTVGGEFTIVGAPVVYACRMGGAGPGETLVNRPAFSRLSGDYAANVHFVPAELVVKHEGRTLAHRATMTPHVLQPQERDWEREPESKPVEGPTGAVPGTRPTQRVTGPAGP